MLSPDAMASDANDRWTAPVLALVAALLAWQLFVPPIVGLADQGDFDRLWRWFGISAPSDDPEQRYLRYLIREWRIDPAAAVSSGFVSADLLFVAASIPLNALLSERGVYDIRALGAVRAAMLLLCAFLLMRVARRGGSPIQAITAFALLFVVADVGYIAYFNSGFTEPGSLLFGLLVIAMFARLVVGEGRRAINVTAFVVSCALLVWSKPQNVLLALPLAILAWRAIASTESRRVQAVAAVCALTILVAAVLYSAFPPPLWYTQQIRHIAVFNSLLLESDDVAADLRELGVDPRWAVLVRRFPWDELSLLHADALESEFHARVDNSSIAAFYLSHPLHAVALLKRSAFEALSVRVGLGEFEAASGRPPFSKARWFALRSDFVNLFAPHRFRWIAAIFGLAVAIAGIAWRAARTRSERRLAEGVLMLALAALIQYAVVALLQGPVAVVKGMFLFAFFYDAMIVGTLALVVYRSVHRRASMMRPACGVESSEADRFRDVSGFD